MKKKILFISSTLLTGISLCYFLSTVLFTENEAAYTQRDLKSLEKQTSDESQAWLRARYIDVTTGLPVTQSVLDEIQKQISLMPYSKSISFTEQGPDNIGGRTRAIQVDRTDVNRLWAGGVSGGLFVSLNKGGTWNRVDEYIDNGASPYISSMTQTKDGTLYVATGSNQEGWNGNGVWYTTDSGLNWTKIPGTSNCTEIESSDADDYAWMATSSGLKKWKLGDASVTNVSTGASGGCNSMKISKDGQVVLIGVGSNKTYVSTDGGVSFTGKFGSASSNLVPTGAARIEYAISHAVNGSGNYSLYAVRTNSNLLSMHVSHDNGGSWTQFVGASAPPNEFDIYRNQGTYNSIVSVLPNNPEQIVIGGIDIWKWTQTVNNPPSGGFEKLSQWFVNPSSSIYVHADNHEMEWDPNDRLYVGNDGGVGVTNDYGLNWYPSNRGYNVTQFYGIAFDRRGSVMGGTQDNGTLYNDHSLSTYKEFREVGGGDGFECEISFYNPNVMFSSVYYNTINRSGDGGQTFTSFDPQLIGGYDPPGTDGSVNHPFHTEFVLAENYDTNSEDSVTYIPTANYSAGDVIMISSAASGDSMAYTTPVDLHYDDTLYYDPSLTDSINYGVNSATGEIVPMGQDTAIFNVAWDTLKVQDPYQSWFLVYINTVNGGELWGTRNATRLSVSNPNWVRVAQNIGGNLYSSVDIEFSKDLNHCYVSAGSGIWRIDGLGSVYTSDPDFLTKVSFDQAGSTPTATTATKINNSGYEGIAVNPSNADDIILFAGFNGTNKRSSNATSASPTFTSLSSITSPSVACYDGIIDRDDSDIIVVGTSSGVWVSENGGSSWDNSSAGFEGTPVFEVRQSWRTFAEGNTRMGEIYAGTFGRGIWSSDAYLGVENPSITEQDLSLNLLVYPNPSKGLSTLNYSLVKNSSVKVNIYSFNGQLIKSVEMKHLNAGNHSIDLPSNDLPKGTYIIQLQTSYKSETTKFIKY